MHNSNTVFFVMGNENSVKRILLDKHRLSCKKMKMLSTKVLIFFVLQTVLCSNGFCKHYHMCFYTKLGHVTCSIQHIPCACIKYKKVLENTWTLGVSPQQQPHYQTIKYWTYCPEFGSFNNWNISYFSNNKTCS